jgi:hypothetical protein
MITPKGLGERWPLVVAPPSLQPRGFARRLPGPRTIRRTTMEWWDDIASIMTACGKQPGRQRVGVSHLSLRSSSRPRSKCAPAARGPAVEVRTWGLDRGIRHVRDGTVVPSSNLERNTPERLTK